MANLSAMFPDFVWGVVDSKTAHTQKAFARLGYCKTDTHAAPLYICSFAKSTSVYGRQCWVYGW